MIRLLVFSILLLTSTHDELLHRAGHNAPAWSGAMSRLHGLQLQRARHLLSELPLLDVLEIDEATILHHVEAGTGLSPRWSGFSVPEDTARAYLIWPTVASWDHVEDWRPLLQEKMESFITASPGSTVRNIFIALSAKIRMEEHDDLFGPPSAPLSTFRRGWGSPNAFAALGVAALRSVGIPARIAPGEKCVDYWNGYEWRSGFCAPEQQQTPTTDPGMIAQSRPSAQLELSLTVNGKPYLVEEAVGLATWNDGRWKPIFSPEWDINFQRTDSSFLFTTTPGKYLITAGIRNAQGEPRVWSSTILLEPDTTKHLAQNLDIPFDELRQRDLISGGIPSLKNVHVFSSDGRDLLLTSLLGKYPLVLVYSSNGSEPCTRLLNDLNERLNTPESPDHELLIIEIEIGFQGRFGDSRGELASALGLSIPTDPADLPHLLVYGRDGNLLLRYAGYGSHIADLAVHVLSISADVPVDSGYSRD